jgi:hypothetical protein
MLRVKVPKLDKNDIINDQLKNFINNVKEMDPLSEIKKDLGEFLSEIDITESKQSIDTRRVSIDNQKLSIENQLVNIPKNSKTKQIKPQIMNNLIHDIINWNM